MAHFAELDSSNKVLRVLVVPNEQEHRGEEFLSEDLGLGGHWIQTSFNATIRGKFAAVGDRYEQDSDTFVHIETEEEAALKALIAAKVAARDSAIDKLTALGLTEEEANVVLP